jgi:hypothetical protein
VYPQARRTWRGAGFTELTDKALRFAQQPGDVARHPRHAWGSSGTMMRKYVLGFGLMFVTVKSKSL